MVKLEEGSEFIASWSLLNQKVTLIKDLATQELIYLLHSENSIYIMDGCQRMSTHQKLAGKLNNDKFHKVWPHLRGQTNGTHIAILFRKLKK